MVNLNIPKKYKIKDLFDKRIYSFLGYRRIFKLRTKFKYFNKLNNAKVRYNLICQLINFNSLGLALIKFYYKSYCPGKGSHMFFLPKSNLFRVWSRRATKPRLHRQLKTNHVIFQFRTRPDLKYFIEETDKLGLAPHIIYPLYVHYYGRKTTSRILPILPFFKHRKTKLERSKVFKMYITTIFRMALKNTFYFYYNKLLDAEPPDIPIG